MLVLIKEAIKVVVMKSKIHGVTSNTQDHLCILRNWPIVYILRIGIFKGNFLIQPI